MVDLPEPVVPITRMTICWVSVWSIEELRKEANFFGKQSGRRSAHERERTQTGVHAGSFESQPRAVSGEEFFMDERKWPFARSAQDKRVMGGESRA